MSFRALVTDIEDEKRYEAHIDLITEQSKNGV